MKAKIIALALVFFSMLASAEMKIVYKGTCWLDDNGVLTFKKEERKSVLQCFVGMDMPDETKHYVLLFFNNEPAKLVLYDETTKKQTTLLSKRSI